MLYVRCMIRRDLPHVMEIVSRPPITDDKLIRCLAAWNCIGLVAEDAQEQIEGWLIYRICKRRMEVLYMGFRSIEAADTLIENLKTVHLGPERAGITLLVHEQLDRWLARLTGSRHGFRVTGLVRNAFGEQDGVRLAWVRTLAAPEEAAILVA